MLNNNPLKNPLKEDKMGTFSFKYKRVRKGSFSNLFSFSVILLSLFIVIGCSSDSGGGSSSTTSDTETTDDGNRHRNDHNHSLFHSYQ